jgi:hypothetical protein
VKAEWVPADPAWPGWYKYVICDSFVLRIEHYEQHRYHVAVLSAERFGSALYRSRKTYTLEEAKVEALKSGRRIALRQARLMTQIADVLRKVEPTP